MYDNERKNITFHFIHSLFTHLEITFFYDRDPKKHWCQKLLLKKQNDKMYTFFKKKQFLLRFLWTRGRLFWRLRWKIFAELPKIFAQVTRTDKFNFSDKKKRFPQNSPFDTYNAVLTSLWKVFHERVELFFLKIRTISRKTMLLDFFSGHVAYSSESFSEKMVSKSKSFCA